MSDLQVIGKPCLTCVNLRRTRRMLSKDVRYNMMLGSKGVLTPMIQKEQLIWNEKN